MDLSENRTFTRNEQQISIIKSSTENPMIFPGVEILVNEIRLPSLFAKQVPLKPM